MINEMIDKLSKDWEKFLVYLPKNEEEKLYRDLCMEIFLHGDVEPFMDQLKTLFPSLNFPYQTFNGVQAYETMNELQTKTLLFKIYFRLLSL